MAHVAGPIFAYYLVGGAVVAGAHVCTHPKVWKEAAPNALLRVTARQMMAKLMVPETCVAATPWC
jgi:hypothetical protein